jgi:hypothetical protein
MCDTSFCSSWRGLNVYRILTLKMLDLDSTSRIQLADRPLNFLFDRPTAQIRRSIWTSSQNCQFFTSIPLLTLWPWKCITLTVILKGKGEKKLHFQSERPQNRQNSDYFEFLHTDEHQTAKSLQTEFSISRSNFQIFIFLSITNFAMWYIILFVLTWTKSLSYSLTAVSRPYVRTIYWPWWHWWAFLHLGDWA